MGEELDISPQDASTKQRPPCPLPEPHPVSINSRQNAIGAYDIGAVVVAEFVLHHAFLAREAAKEQDAEPDQPGAAREPVRKQQRLCHRPEPEGGIHGMADTAIDAVGDELMALAQFE